MSRIRFDAVSAGILLFVSGCTDPELTGLPPGARHVAHEQVDTLAHEFYSGVTQGQREVLRSQTEWAAFWETIYANRSPKPALPVVDFDESVVLVASLGSRSTGGYSIDVEGVYQASSGLHVVVQETSPAQSCVVTTAETQPVVAVRVPRIEGAITFVERKSLRDC